MLKEKSNKRRPAGVLSSGMKLKSVTFRIPPFHLTVLCCDSGFLTGKKNRSSADRPSDVITISYISIQRFFNETICFHFAFFTQIFYKEFLRRLLIKCKITTYDEKTAADDTYLFEMENEQQVGLSLPKYIVQIKWRIAWHTK